MTIPKSIHHVIASFLKDELEKAGIKTVFTAPDTLSGRRTGLLCENGSYLVETAFTEKSLLEAINKIQTFRSHNIRLKGGFVVVCPDDLSESVDNPSELLKIHFKILLFSLTDTRNFTVNKGTLPEIAEMASAYIREPSYSEPSIEWIITILRMAAAYIAEGLKVTGAQLEPIFQSNHVFRNILHKKEKYPVNALKLVSAYLVVNQLLFYHILSKKSQLPEINTESLTTPSQLNRYFDLVSATIFQVLFSYDVVSKIPKEHTTRIKKVVNIIKGITPEIKKDVLGTIFHDVIPLDVRKYIAAFYTNIYAADLLAWLSIDDPDACVADFAVGSGGLLVAAYKRKKHLLDQEHSKKFTEKDHKKFIAQLVGVDVMPFAANTAACHLALQYPECDTTVNIAVWDSTALHPHSKIPLIAVATPAGENPDAPHISLTQYDVILMNPPFTRQERVPTAYKPLLRDRFNDYKQYLHGQISYYGYFVLLADRFLKEGGRLAFVLPAAFLRVQSSRTIIALLANKYHIEYIITGKKRLNFSESTWRREILLIARKLKKEKRKNAIFAVLESLPKTEDELEQISKKIKRITSDYEDYNMSAFTVPVAELEKDYDWFRFITSSEPGLLKTWEKIRTSALHLEKFGNICNVKTIKEGIESRKEMKVQAVFVVNSKERAIRKEDAWIVDTIEKTHITVFNRYNNTKIHIPKESVIPCLRTMSHNSSINIDTTDFVVVKDFLNAHQFFYGERAVLKTRLPVWNQYVKDRRGNLIILRRFVITAPGTTHVCYYSPTVTAAPGTAWVSTIDDDDAKILCLWFNSSIHLAQVLTNRIEDIWIDIHKYILREFSIINPHTLSNKEKKKLLELFDKVSKEKTPSLAEQYISVPESKKEIDTIILSVLGFDDNEIKNILSDLYASLKTEFEALQKINCSSW